jgi:hypothetical protein
VSGCRSCLFSCWLRVQACVILTAGIPSGVLLQPCRNRWSGMQRLFELRMLRSASLFLTWLSCWRLTLSATSGRAGTCSSHCWVSGLCVY